MEDLLNENQLSQNTCSLKKSNEIFLHFEADKFPEYWKELREQKQFCDGIIKLPSGNLTKIHRIVLSSCSPYFKAIFTYNSISNASPLSKKQTKCSKNSEANSSIEDISINIDVADSTMDVILDYAYSGFCPINWSNVEELLTSADRYQIVGIVGLCCKFLLKQLTPENCIGIYLFAKNYFCKELEDLTKSYILRTVSTIIETSSELKQLDGEELKSILSSEHLNVNDEEVVFDAIKSWVEADPVQRSKWISELLPCIRFGLIKNKSFKDRVINWKFMTENMDVETITVPSQNKPRIPNQIIMVVGGWIEGSPSNSVEVYDTRADMWLKMRHRDTLRAYHGVCTIDQKVYVLGGFNGYIHYNSMRCFDPVEYRWEEKACMYHPRCYVCVAVLERKIYAIGGFDGHIRLNSVERYDPDRNQWELLSPMRRFRSDAAAVALEEHIYVIGGFNGTDVLNCCEMYDPESDCWTLVSFMLNPRSGAGLIAYNDYLYAIGGFSGQRRLKSVERYSPRNPKWNLVSNMMIPRSNFGTVIIDGIFYVIGGFNGSSTISFVEKYDPVTDIWQAAAQMNYSRSAQSACVLKDLPNIKAYSLQCIDIGDISPCFLTSDSSIVQNKLLEYGIENDSRDGIVDIDDSFENLNLNNIFGDGEPFIYNNLH